MRVIAHDADFTTCETKVPQLDRVKRVCQVPKVAHVKNKYKEISVREPRTVPVRQLDTRLRRRSDINAKKLNFHPPHELRGPVRWDQSICNCRCSIAGPNINILCSGVRFLSMYDHRRLEAAIRLSATEI